MPCPSETIDPIWDGKNITFTIIGCELGVLEENGNYKFRYKMLEVM